MIHQQKVTDPKLLGQVGKQQAYLCNLHKLVVIVMTIEKRLLAKNLQLSRC